MSQLVDMPIWGRLGLTLTHFLWQGALVAMLLGAVLALMSRRSPGARYVVCLVGLGVLLVCPVATFWYVQANPEVTPFVRLRSPVVFTGSA